MQQDIRDLGDAARVVLVANHLEISEFEVFRRAFVEWLGRDGETRSLEREFARYLYSGATPAWVRHHTRSVLLGRPEALPAARRGAGAGTALARLFDNRLGRYLLS